MRWLPFDKKDRSNGMRKFGARAGLLSPKPCARAKTQKLGRAMSSRKWTAASSSTAPRRNERHSARSSRPTSRRSPKSVRAKHRAPPRNRDWNGSCGTNRSCVPTQSLICGLNILKTIVIGASLKLLPAASPGGRDQYKPEMVKPGRFRKDGSPRANAATKAPPKPPKKVEPGTVKRELTVLKKVIDHRKRKLGLLINPLNTEDVKRPVVNDERDVRLEDDQIDALVRECYQSKNPWVGPIVDFAFEEGARRGNLLRLRWDDVDLKGRSILLRGLKNSRNPETIINVPVGLSPRAFEILKGLPRSLDGRVFPISANALKSAFNRARHKPGLDHS